MILPKTGPLPDWTDEDVFIIGGGPSLENFDVSQLLGCKTIGCNTAYLHGEPLCNICCFGDNRFWVAHQCHMRVWYTGWLVTNFVSFDWVDPRTSRVSKIPDWIKFFPRKHQGLAGPGEDCLGWNANTGAMAINLALQLGAQRIYLLGFDCRKGTPTDPDKTHWHDQPLSLQNEGTYDVFRTGLQRVAEELPKLYPGRQVFNVTDGYSRLYAFPRLTFQEVGLVSEMEIVLV